MEHAASPSLTAASPRESAAAHPAPSSGRREVGFRAAVAAVLAAGLAIALGTVVLQRAHHLELGRARAESDARAMAVHLRELLAAPDELLRAIETQAVSATNLADLRHALASSPAVEAVRTLRRAGIGPIVEIYDRNGVVIAGDAEPSRGVAAFREALRARSPSTAFLAVGTTPGSLHLVRPVRGRDAVLLWGAVVQLDTRALGHVLSAAASPDRAVSLRATDGRWLGTWPASAGTVAADGIVAIAPVEGYPCEIVVSQVAGAAVPAWWWSAAPALAANVVLVVLVLSFSLWACRRLGRKEQDASAHREAAGRSERARHDMELLLAGMSRHLRSPLNAVCGLVDILRGMPMPAQQSKIVDVLALSSDALRGVANDLLDVSALDAEPCKEDAAPLNVRDFVDAIVASARAADGVDGQMLYREVASDVPIAVVVDRTRLGRILLHLLHNALRFSHRHAVSLSVRRIGGDDRRPIVSFAVVDSGWGIPPDVRERLLQPAASPASTIDAGLAISNRLALRLGGRLETMSIEGLGSSVAVCLALEVVAAEGVPHPDACPATPRPLRILVAEDTYGSQMVARLALERLGHRVVVAADGEAAVRAFRESGFDVVLMDIDMPGMDGLEATRRIRACGRPGADRTPIIGVSALAAADDIEAAIASGMTLHLAKPVSVAALEAALAGLPAQQRGAVADAAVATGTADPEPAASAALEELARDLGADMMLVATRQFQHDADILLERLSSAQGAGDGAGVQKAAHALKGLFRQFGVPALAQVASSLDRNPAAGSPEAAPPVNRIVEAAPAAIARVIAQAEDLARAAR